MTFFLFSLILNVDFLFPVYNLDVQHSNGFSLNISNFSGKDRLKYGLSLEVGSLRGRYGSEYSLNFLSLMPGIKIVPLSSFVIYISSGISYIERRLSENAERDIAGISKLKFGFEKNIYSVPVGVYTGTEYIFSNRDFGVLWVIGTGFSF